MKIKLFIPLLYIFLCINCSFSQDFLEIKYSINDIKKQRGNFKNEKIKSVTVITNYRENIYEIGIEGKIINVTEKSSGAIDVSYSYDLNANLIIVDYRLAPNNFEFDTNGNVVKYSGEEYAASFFYDSENRLIKEDIESEIESCPFEKIIYNDLQMEEKIYPCCEGFRIMKINYEYYTDSKLKSINHFSRQCAGNKFELSRKEEYLYKEGSNLPYKMIDDTEETFFTYEYYD